MGCDVPILMLVVGCAGCRATGLDLPGASKIASPVAADAAYFRTGVDCRTPLVGTSGWSSASALRAEHSSTAGSRRATAEEDGAILAVSCSAGLRQDRAVLDVQSGAEAAISVLAKLLAPNAMASAAGRR